MIQHHLFNQIDNSSLISTLTNVQRAVVEEEDDKEGVSSARYLDGTRMDADVAGILPAPVQPGHTENTVQPGHSANG
ncbi:hypothetical protein Y032_0059g2992 [Ancylostoma ceylanicum]|uniref:Uncharacterized protein n=1 Tax=Ancylostoma ceylanicum TaxID=53326 RepID=A0A016U3Y4_9BILA|nr:hypothetical protein Y032_0059g2992 [Ancylostoma ceylanicum]